MIPADSAMADSATDNQPGQGNTWKYGVPYPGGDWSKRGGHIVGFFCRGVQGLGGENLSNKVGLFWGGSCTCHPYDIEYGMGRLAHGLEQLHAVALQLQTLVRFE